MDYSSYITAANTQKDSWDTKITALKVEAEAAEEEETGGSSSSTSSSTSSSSSSGSTSSTNRLDAIDEDDVSIFSDIKITNDLDYASIISTTNERTSRISDQLEAMREEAEADEAREEAEREAASSTTTSGASDTKVLEEGKATLEEIKLRNEDPIEGFYQDILGRDSDPEGKEYWQRKFDEGMSLTDIQEQFLRSDEYKNKKKE
jgi:Leucine-rich repeat (LRR) protein